MIRNALIFVAVAWMLSVGLVKITPETGVATNGSGIQGVAVQLAQLNEQTP